jgi:hypothetical protein
MASQAHAAVLLRAVHAVLRLEQALRLRDSDVELQDVAARVEPYIVGSA